MILHFWALEAEKDGFGAASGGEPDPTAYLQRAYEATTEALSTPEEWLGTTTACGALLHSTTPAEGAPQPVLFVTQLGDSEVLVIRPRGGEIVYKTEEQWHWFDCPRQLGTNSPDTPAGEAVTARVEVAEDDVVLAMSDGVTDNLWEHEVVANVLESLRNAKLVADDGAATGAQGKALAEGMQFVATQLAKAARVIAQDPFAESPFMERAVDEGLPMEGGTCAAAKRCTGNRSIARQIWTNATCRQTRRHQRRGGNMQKEVMMMRRCCYGSVGYGFEAWTFNVGALRVTHRCGGTCWSAHERPSDGKN